MHTCTRTHAHMCTCVHTILMYHLGGGVGEAVTETCTHVHVCTHNAHVQAFIQAHGHGHTIYKCPHKPAEAQEEACSEPAPPGLRQEIPAVLDTSLSHSDSMVLCYGHRNVGLPAIISQEPKDTLKTGVHL